MGDEPISIGRALDAVMRSLRGPGRREVGGVFGRWEELVGPQIAQHARPARLDGGVLLIEVDDPAWATQIQLMALTLRERILAEVGAEIEEVQVRVSRAPRGGGNPRGPAGRAAD